MLVGAWTLYFLGAEPLQEMQPRSGVNTRPVASSVNHEGSGRTNEALQEFEQAEKAAEARREQEKIAKTDAAQVGDFVVELSTTLTALEDSVVDYRENKDGKPNLPLIYARHRHSVSFFRRGSLPTCWPVSNLEFCG
jgi:hypothetical protein